MGVSIDALSLFLISTLRCSSPSSGLNLSETALKLACCDGPPYYYMVAYEEAERLLERLKV